MDLKLKIREIPDFPKEGILFYDVTTLLKDPAAFKIAVNRMVEHYTEKGIKVDKVVSMESRGFILGSILAYELEAGFVHIRKPGKLPSKSITEEYVLEYGTDKLEMHEDAIEKGENVLVVDDLLATGGTCAATVKLIEKLGGKVVSCGFLIELTFLNGRDKLRGHDVFALLQYDK
ncbi:adenine phosphoribosyltransferase [Candidatus Micrarchaeota archaeon]|nr:adenine phosphoribosyltransferase [Candidatus Micrarchaeota archaeon]